MPIAGTRTFAVPHLGVPQVIAHRGASESAPEHTLAAYQRAIDDGADALECDIRLTRDGVPVCVHDRRVDRTSNGRGVVSTLELADLSELDFGSWHAAARDAAEEPDRDCRSVLTLDRLLQLIAGAGRPVDLAIETKHPTRYAGLVEHAVTETLRRHGMLRYRPGRSNARIMSFSALGLRRVHALAPELPTVLLLYRLLPPYRSGLLPARVGIAGPSMELIRRYPEYVERVHAKGGIVHVWTVDDPVDVRRCLDLGVDGIITNRPELVRAAIGR